MRGFGMHAEQLDSASGLKALGDAIVHAARALANPSGVCFLPFLPGATAAVDGTYFHEQHAPAVMRDRTLAFMPMTERDIGGVVDLFASGQRVIDVNERLARTELTRTVTFNEFWRPSSIERQLLAVIGPPSAPRGFVCISRSARERPFNERERRGLLWLQRRAERALGRLTLEAQDSTLELLSGVDHALAHPCALFDATGAQLWISARARHELAGRAVPFNANLILQASDAIERWREAARRAVASGARVSQIRDLRVQQLRQRRGGALVLVTRVSGVGSAPAPPWLPPSLAAVAAGVVAGLSDKEIAGTIDAPLATVRTYVQRIYRRCGVRSRVELTRWWLRATEA